MGKTTEIRTPKALRTVNPGGEHTSQIECLQRAQQRPMGRVLGRWLSVQGLRILFRIWMDPKMAVLKSS